MGSVAETVVRTAPCPVLTVRKPPREYVTPNILVPTDFGVASDTALSYGRTLAHTFGGRLHLLHVMENYFMRPIVADPHALEAAARRQLGERLTPSDRDSSVRLPLSRCQTTLQRPSSSTPTRHTSISL